MKKFCRVFLIVAVLLLCAALIPTKAQAATSGYYTYTTSEGKATITDVNTSISGAITIPSQLGGYPVTSIGERAFFFCSSLTSITIPNSVTSIGERAFFFCSSLTSITIPNSVTSIGNNAFSDCESLQSITIPNSVTSIGISAFSHCESLQSITIPDSVTSIGDRAFEDCTDLTSITIPNSVTSIGLFTFSGCTSLTSITIPDRVTIISGMVFYNCTSLTSITIPDGVTGIGYGAFGNCRSLTSITIPGSVTGIHYSALSGCTGLKDIYFIGTKRGWKNISGSSGISTSATIHFTVPYTYTVTDGKATITGYDQPLAGDITIPSEIDGIPVVAIGDSAFEDCTDITSVTISDGVESIAGSAFYGCENLETVSIGDSVSNIEMGAFSEISKFTAFNVSGNNPYYASQSGVLFDKEMKILIKMPEGYSGGYTIPESVTSIGESAFCYCNGLTSITIPNSVTSIGVDAFYACEGLTSATIPDSVTSIGEWAFNECSSLKTVTIGKGVAKIENLVFDGCSQLLKIDVHKDNQYFASDASGVLFNKSMTVLIKMPEGFTGKYTIPSSVKEIYSHAFQSCVGLTDVTIPEGVTKIGFAAFRLCEGLTGITLPHSLTTIESEAFAACTNLGTINIGKGLINLEEYAFSTEGMLNGIYVDPENPNFTSDGRGVLYNKKMSELIQAPCLLSGSYTIPDSVTKIYDNAFDCCEKLTQITIGRGVTEIEWSTFSYCSSLTTVTIPDSVKSIADYAFYECSSLEDVYFGGTKQGWDAIEIGDGNSSLTNATIHYYCNHAFDADGVCTKCGALNCIPGDLTGDGKINSLDGLLLMRYLNGWDVNIASPEAMDVNGDGKVNSLDGLILMRYLNGWNVTLG